MAPIDNNSKNLSNDDSEYTSYEIAQRKKEAEDMLKRLIDREVKLQIKALEEKRKEKDDTIKQKENALAEKDAILEQMDKAIEEKDKAIEELKRQLEAFKNEK